jgi:hypothetical protein
MHTTEWYGLHIHRYTEQDAFLVDAVAPAVAPLYDSGVLERSFFLRYWQGGHHIRLRLRLAGPDPESGERHVREVAGRLAAHLAEFPGGPGPTAEEFRDAQATMAALESETPDELRPPDSIHRVPYTPEYGKYGGEDGVAIAERFFDRSSAVALAALRAIDGSSAKRLGTAFSMMLRGLGAARLSPADMAAFFAHYCVVRASMLMPKPAHLSWEEAACNPLCAGTAYRMLVSDNGARMKQGDVVLIWGATGGLGAYGVQFVKNGGGIAVGVVSSAAKEELALKLGAAGIARYPLDEKADVILDAAGGELFDQALDSLASFGRLVSYGNAWFAWYMRRLAERPANVWFLIRNLV